MYQIKIDQTKDGYDIQVGCKSFFFSTAEGMLAELTAYLKDPHGVEDAVNKRRYKESGFSIGPSPGTLRYDPTKERPIPSYQPPYYPPQVFGTLTTDGTASYAGEEIRRHRSAMDTLIDKTVELSMRKVEPAPTETNL